MATFIFLVNDTNRSVQNIKNTRERAESFKKTAEEVGITVKDLYWTQGQFDGVAVLEAPDAETVLSLALRVGSQGDIRTQTLRAFSAEEMTKIIASIP